MSVKFVKFHRKGLDSMRYLSGTNSKLIAYILIHMDEGNRISCNMDFKAKFLSYEQTYKNHKLCMSAVNNSLTYLTRQKFIARIKPGYYIANPHMYCKCTSGKILDLIKEYDRIANR
jgi:hypothetical protein